MFEHIEHNAHTELYSVDAIAALLEGAMNVKKHRSLIFARILYIVVGGLTFRIETS